MNHVFLILGSNIEKEKNIPRAVDLLRERTTVIQVAGVYESTPVGLVEQPVFWNTAVHIETGLDAADIKNEIIAPIEEELNRVRGEDKNAPRTIDLDIVLFNQEAFKYDPGDGRLRAVPDPDLSRFPHVAVPIAELAPNLPHPVTGVPLQTIADRLVKESMADGRPSLFRRDDIVSL
jgi:2-amino-4-hydroxy-6-hydroxymethyldihydropteridine diphosphokinase